MNDEKIAKFFFRFCKKLYFPSKRHYQGRMLNLSCFRNYQCNVCYENFRSIKSIKKFQIQRDIVHCTVNE